MFIQGLGTAVPPYQYTQAECWQALTESPFLTQLTSRSQAILRKVLLGDCGIEHRHFAMASLDEAFSLDPDALHQRFANNAPALAAEAARRALENAGCTTDDIDAVVVSTCTGYLCPGLTSYVSESLNLKHNILAADLVGHGCAAALPNLQLASAYLGSGQAQRVLCICVEVCSAAFYLDNNPGVLISACLFADGAGALVLGTEPGPSRRVELQHFARVLNPTDRDLLRFETRGGMLRNVLDKSVPVIAVEHLGQMLSQLEATSGVPRSHYQAWIVHGGGRDVLAGIEQGLNVPREMLRWSAAVLKRYGNISSPSVIFALQNALSENIPAGPWLMASFGAGITCQGALLQVS